jgi:hypothetical protein
LTLFADRHLSVEQVETRLKRSLRGDPTQGEIAVLSALNADDEKQVRWGLRTPGIGPDFRQLIEAHLRDHRGREAGLRYISIGVPPATWDEYAKEARLTGRRPSECLADAIERDRQARAEAADVRGSLERNLREFINTARQMLDELRARGEA